MHPKQYPSPVKEQLQEKTAKKTIFPSKILHYIQLYFKAMYPNR